MKVHTCELLLQKGTMTRPAAELDGDQDLQLYWIDPVDAMDRLVARPEFKGKIYLQYERQESEQRPTKRAFGRANSGLVFQEAQALDLNSKYWHNLRKLHNMHYMHNVYKFSLIILYYSGSFADVHSSFRTETSLITSLLTPKRCIASSMRRKTLLVGEILTTQMWRPLNSPIRIG